MIFFVNLILSLLLPFAAAQKVGEISSEDQQRVKTRVESLSLTSISFGPAFATDMSNDNMFYSIHFGKNWEVTTNAEIRLNADGAMASKDEGSWISGSLGGSWFFLTDNFSPLVGAEFGYGYAHINGATDPSGFLIGGYAGVRFFRTATAQMSVEYYIHSILDNMNPVMNGIRVGILF